MAKPPKKDDKPKVSKKEVDPTLSRQERLDILTAGLLKKYNGRVMLLQGSAISNTFMLRRPTGIITLDLHLGGGFPSGGLTQIIGGDSSGKSYLVNRTIANVQSIYGPESAIGICMTEMPWDKDFAKRWCDVRVAFNDLEIARLQKLNLEHGHPDFTPENIAWLKDQIGWVQEVMAATAEDLLETACQMVESNLYQIVLIDSFGALLTKAEAEADEGIADKHRGGAAMTITQFMHRLHAALNMPDANGRQNTTTVIGINQYRDNMNAGLYGNPLKEAGGWSLKHGKLVDLLLSKGKKLSVKIGDEYKTLGKEINWEIIKGKAGCHDGPKGTYNFYFGEQGHPKGVDTIFDLCVAGLEHGVIEQSGAHYSFRGERIGHGADNVRAMLSGNSAWVDEIRKDIFKHADLNFIVKEDY